MLARDVPQEGNRTLDGHHKALYAKGADGKLRLTQSAGWEVEEIVTRQAIDDLLRLTEDARLRVIAGQTSALEYHMHRLRMDVSLLSQLTGLWQWRIRRHFQPAIFARLTPALISRYTEAMGLTPEQLGRIE